MWESQTIAIWVGLESSMTTLHAEVLVLVAATINLSG